MIRLDNTRIVLFLFVIFSASLFLGCAATTQRVRSGAAYQINALIDEVVTQRIKDLEERMGQIMMQMILSVIAKYGPATGLVGLAGGQLGIKIHRRKKKGKGSA